jgi:glycosyltransferase involved in cell wall biosynthesis
MKKVYTEMTPVSSPSSGTASDALKFSVITPSLNQGQFIRETIESVLTQDYPHVEYWVMDGGSTDNTLDILREYEGRLHWVSEKDEGQADAVNKGIQRATGDIIAWINSDDTYAPGVFTLVANFFQQHPETWVVYGQANHMDATGQDIGPAWVLGFSEHEEFKAFLAQNCFISQPALFFRQSLVEAIGYLDSALYACMDYDYWIRASRSTVFAHLPVCLAYARMYPENKTLGQSRIMLRENIALALKYYDYAPSSWTGGYADYCVMGKYPFWIGAETQPRRRLASLLNLFFLLQYNLFRRQGRKYLMGLACGELSRYTKGLRFWEGSSQSDNPSDSKSVSQKDLPDDAGIGK